jgi:hypothetical protein
MLQYGLMVLCLCSSILLAQPEPAMAHWEIVPLQVSSQVATYRGRNVNNRQLGEGRCASIVLYMPFQWQIHKQFITTDTVAQSGYFFNRQFWFRPLVGIQITDDFSTVTHASFGFNFKLHSRMYAVFHSGLAWVEANSNSRDGLSSGFNLIQQLNVIYTHTSHWAFGMGIQHISPAHIFKGESNQDALSIWILHQF